MKTKGAREVMTVINQMHLQLRTAGYSVVRLHTDRAKEFCGKYLARGVLRTRTAGVSVQATVQEGKARIQGVLVGADMDYICSGRWHARTCTSRREGDGLEETASLSQLWSRSPREKMVLGETGFAGHS